MIELINKSRHLSLAIFGTWKYITLRVKLKGTSLDGRQNTLKLIHNEHIISGNTFSYRLKPLSKAVEIMVLKNGVEKSVGFIPEEIVRVLNNNDAKAPTIQGTEIRKHLEHGSAPEFGAVVRLVTSIPASRYMEMIKEFEASIAMGPTIYVHKEEHNGHTETRGSGENPRSTGRSEEPTSGAKTSSS